MSLIQNLEQVKLVTVSNDVVEFCKKFFDTSTAFMIEPFFGGSAVIPSHLFMVDAAVYSEQSLFPYRFFETIKDKMICLITPELSFPLKLELESKFPFCLEIPCDEELFVDCVHDVLRNIQEACEGLVRKIKNKHCKKSLFHIMPKIRSRLPGSSVASEELRWSVIRAAEKKTNVLILGETGTGKSTIAKIIHDFSGRAASVFQTVDIPKIPDGVADGFLFGIKEGIFTDVIETDGVFQKSNGGVVFFDGINLASEAFQTKLSAFLGSGKIQKLGSVDSIEVDVRCIFSANSNLSELIESGKFLKDLFFKISETIIRIPPLRERVEDIKDIAESVVLNAGRQLSEGAVEKLKGYYWPGNITELINCVKRAIDNTDEKIITEDDIIFYDIKNLNCGIY